MSAGCGISMGDRRRKQYVKVAAGGIAGDKNCQLNDIAGNVLLWWVAAPTGERFLEHRPGNRNMILWTGWGIMVWIIWGVILFFTRAAIDSIYEDGYFVHNLWPNVLASAISGPIIWTIGRRLNGKPSSRDGPNVEEAPHTLLFVPMEYWGPILFAIGIIIPIVRNG